MVKDLKKLFKHIVIYGSGVVMGKAVGFLLIPLYTRFLTPKDYGILELLNLTVYFIAIVVTMGIGAAIFRYYYTYNEVAQKKKVISTAFLLVALVNVIFTAILVVYSKSVSSAILGYPSFSYFVILILIANFFDTQNGIILSYIQVQKKSILYTIISVSRLIIALILNIVFIVYLKMGVSGVLWSSIISAALSFLYLFILYTRKIGFSFSKAIAIEMTKYSIPLVPTTIFMLLLHFGNRYILKMYLSLEAVGVYSLGYKFGFVVQFLIAVPFYQIWAPYRFELDKENKAKKLYPKILTYYCLATVSFCLVMSVLIRDILRFMVGPAFWEAYKVVPLIAFGYVILGLTYVFETGILIRKKTYLNAIAAGIAALVCLASNFYLIPLMGMMGAAWATMISFLVLAALTYIFTIKLYPLSYEWIRLGKLFLAAFIIYFGAQFIPTGRTLPSLFFRSISIIGFPILLFLFRFFESKEIEKMRGLLGFITIRIRRFVPSYRGN